MEMMLMQLYDSGNIFLISDRLTSSLIKVRWVLPSLLHLTYFELAPTPRSRRRLALTNENFQLFIIGSVHYHAKHSLWK